MGENSKNENINLEKNTFPISLKITEFDITNKRPIPHDVSLEIHTEEKSVFSIEIIVIPLIYYNPDDKKQYSWEVRKTYKSFRNLLDFIEELLPTKNHYLSKKKNKKNLNEIRKKKEETLPLNYKEKFYRIYKMNFSKMRQIPKIELTNFIEMIINSFLYTYYTIKEFFEISNHSFLTYNNGLKPKEGEMLKQAEYAICQKTLIDICHCTKKICCAGRKRYWFLLRTDMICYLDSSSSKIGKGAFWFDQVTKIKKSKKMIILKNSIHKLKLYFQEEFQRDLWFNEINWRVEKIINNYQGNIFHSFVLEKQKCKCDLFVDAKDYFLDLKNKLLKARESVYITDWWLSPELFLQRPVNLNTYKNLNTGESINLSNENISRLCDILKKIAEKGVKVYILIYKEVSLALSLNSKHSKTFLINLHPNIKVTRHPQKSIDLLWSHHEKLVIIDQQYAYIGGLDLCWGRYDNNNHPIIEPNNIDNIYYYPGIDYNNARIRDFENVNNYLKESINRNMVKMPWHDIHSCIQGPAVLDVSRHFVERWNYSKSNENSEGITDIKTVYTRRVSIGTNFFKGFLGNAIQKVIEKENNINHEENNKEDENNKNINFKKENVKDGNYNNEKENSNNGAFNNYRNLNSSNNNFNNNNCGDKETNNINEINIKNGNISFRAESNNNRTTKISTSKRQLKDNVSNSNINNNNIEVKNSKSSLFINDLKDNLKNLNSSYRNNNKPNKIKLNLWEKVNRKREKRLNNGLDDNFDKETKRIKNIYKKEKKETKETNGNSEITNNTNSNMLELNYTNNLQNLIEIDENKRNEEANFDFVRKFSKKESSDSLSVNSKNEKKEKKKKTDYYELLKNGFKKQLRNFKIFKSNDEESTIINNINLQSYQIEFKESEIKMSCQCLRSLSYWSGGLNKTETSILNAYYHLIEKSEHYIYIENQFFISKSFTDEEYQEMGSSVSNLIINEIALKIRERIIKAHREKKKFRVIIFIPLLPGFAGNVQESSTLQIILKFTYKAISRNNGLSLIEKLRELLDEKDPNLFRKYIAFFSLRNHDKLNGIPVTELIYIHSKLMIIDDKYVIMGSANINDRSMIGDRDSEFDVLLKDENESENYNSIINGENFKASIFAKKLRINLWKEHLGIDNDNESLNLLNDPLSDEVWDLINNTAKINTETYRNIFNCYPDDKFAYFKDIPNRKDYTEQDLVKLIENYNLYKNNIKGHIVEFPLEFLSKEILERNFFSAEIFVPIKNFV